ncbi:MAG: DUF6090 family protein [Flavobacteriaceae bacterium]
MLQFFRRIRKRLLIENQFSRYLLYAFGEILLVVIGILIALQINNWNENKKNHALEKNYLMGLISDLDYDIAAYSLGIEEIEDHRKSADALLLCYKEQRTLPEQELIEHMTIVGLISRIGHRNTVMDDMKSAGRLNLIRSDSVRQELIAYHTLAANTIDNNDRNNDWILTHIIGSRVYAEQFDFNSTVAATTRLPDIMKSIEVNPFEGLPLLNDLDHPDRNSIINLLTAKTWLQGLNKAYALRGRQGAIALKELLEAYLAELERQ